MQVVFKNTQTDNTVFNSTNIPIEVEAVPNREYDNQIITTIIDIIEEKRAQIYEYRKKAMISSYRLDIEEDMV